MNIKDKAIKLIIQKGIKTINENMDLTEVWNNSQGEGRTLNFEIIDSQNLVSGFSMCPYNGTIVLKEVGFIKNPTVTLRTTKDTFLSLCLQRITLEEALLYGDADLDGENWLRDYKIFQPLFVGFEEVLNDVVPSDR